MLAESTLSTKRKGAHRTQRFVYDAEHRLVQELKETGSRQYLYSPDDPYAPLARLDTPAADTDTQAWSKVVGEEYTTPDFDQPLRFEGQYADTSTGLHYNTFRYYDPDIGRFISQDPIGLAGGDNLYAYAPNPTGWVDPWGWCGTTNSPKLSGFLRNKLKRIRNQTAAGGNLGISGKVSEQEALKLGQHLVGEGHTAMSNGQGLVSVDRLRTFRYPAEKTGVNPRTGEPWSKTGRQVNFETKPAPGLRPTSNVNLDVE